jgi:hypothetical protein
MHVLPAIHLPQLFIDWLMRAVYVFDGSLNNNDRAVVHDLCKKQGLISKSHGCADVLVATTVSCTCTRPLFKRFGGLADNQF